MMLAITLAAALLAMAALAAGLTLTVGVDRRFEARLSGRLRPEAQAGEPRRLAAKLAPRMLAAVITWGEKAGRGALHRGASGELRAQLAQGGFYSPHAAEAYFGIRAAAAAGGAVAALLTLLAVGLTHPIALAFGGMLAANLGLLIPKMLLTQRIKARGQALKLALPDAIDLMVVAVEAGSTLSSAIQRVQAEFGELHPVLAEHLGLLLLEMQAGSSRTEALSRFADRAGIEEARNLATLLIQSEAVGASVGGTLRVFAEEVRKGRVLEAERRAAELPVKMAFPLVFFIFPCLTGVVFIPIAIRFLRSMFGG